MSDLEKNKRNAQAFYDLLFNQYKPREVHFYHSANNGGRSVCLS
jgi:hypothetical protein